MASSATASSAAARRALGSDTLVTPVFAYLAHTIRLGAREIPYAVIAGVELDRLQPAMSLARAPIRDDQVWLNAWAAEGLGAKAGDTVTIGYDVWDDAGAMASRETTLTVGGILPMSGIGADPTLTPDFPGISDRTTVADWDPSFPVDLSRITPRDEAYWKQYKAAPKAFVSYATADRLWSGRFGRMTSLRIMPPAADVTTVAATLAKGLTLEDAGIVVQPVRQKAIEASEGTTDFGEYFFYFSFFLVVAALLLTGLFFRVGVEQRLREIGLLEAVGLPPSGVRGLFLREGAVLAAAGSLLGVAGAIGYAWLIMLGLRTWWVGAVGTTALRLQPSPLMLAAGAIAGWVTAIGVLLLMLRQVGRAPVPALLKGALEAGDGAPRPGRKARPARARAAAAWGRAALATLVAAALLLAAAFGAIPQAAAFFGAGAGAMAAGLFALSGWLRRRSTPPSPSSAWRGLFTLGLTSARARPGRQRARGVADCVRDVRGGRGRRLPPRRDRLAGRRRVRHRRLHADGRIGRAADVRSGHGSGPCPVRPRLAGPRADARRRHLRSVPHPARRRQQLPQPVSARQPAHRGAVAGLRRARRPFHVCRDDCGRHGRRTRQPLAPARSPRSTTARCRRSSMRRRWSTSSTRRSATISPCPAAAASRCGCASSPRCRTACSSPRS